MLCFHCPLGRWGISPLVYLTTEQTLLSGEVFFCANGRYLAWRCIGKVTPCGSSAYIIAASGKSKRGKMPPAISGFAHCGRGKSRLQQFCNRFLAWAWLPKWLPMRLVGWRFSVGGAAALLPWSLPPCRRGRFVGFCCVALFRAF